MDINFITLNIALLVPVLILYFQNKDKILELYLISVTEIHSALKAIPIVIAIYFIFRYLDIFNYPSTINPIFIGKQFVCDLILLVFNFIIFSLIMNIYFLYYSFIKLSLTNRVLKVFNFLYDKNLKNRTRNKWEKNIKLYHELNDQSSVSLLTDKYHKYNFSKRKLGKIINRIYFPFKRSKVRISLFPGTEINYDGNTIFSYDSKRKPFFPFIVSVIDNYENMMMEITKYLVNNVTNQINDKSYSDAFESISLLKGIFDKITDCSFEYLYLRDIYREIHFMLRNITQEETDAISWNLITDFSEMILIRSVDSKFIEPITYATNTVFKNKSIQIESEGLINKGIAYTLSKLLVIDYETSQIRETKKLDIIIKSVLEYFHSLNNNEKETVLHEIEIYQYRSCLEPYFDLFRAFISNSYLQIHDEHLSKTISNIKSNSFLIDSVYNYLDTNITI